MRTAVRLLSLIVLVGAPVAAPAQSWPLRLGGSLANTAEAVTVGADGNVYLTGSFHGGFLFGAEGEPLAVSAGGEDIFLAKIDAAGKLVWLRTAGGTGGDRGVDIAVDRSGNVAVTGFFSGSATFGQSVANEPGVTLEAGGSATASFVAVWDRLGFLQWAVRATGSTARAVAFDASANVYVAGEYTREATFVHAETHAEVEPIVRRAPWDFTNVFAGRISRDGRWTWVAQVEGDADDVELALGLDLAVDGAGNGYVVGDFRGSAVRFGSTTRAAAVTRRFVARIDATGEWLWAVVDGGLATGVTHRIAVDAAGTNVYHTRTRDDRTSAVVKRSAANGALVWTSGFRAQAEIDELALATGGSGRVYVGGAFLSPLVLDGGPTIDSATGVRTGFVAALTDSGAAAAWQWADRAPDDSVVTSLATDRTGTTFVAGSFRAAGTFGRIALEPLATPDAFLTAWNVCGQPQTSETWTVGEEVPLPPCALAAPPDIEIVAGQTAPDAEDHFFWCPLTEKLYPLRAVTAVVRWRVVGEPQGSAHRIAVPGTSFWPEATSIHIAGAPAELERPDTRDSFRLSALHSSESEATVSERDKVFQAAKEGYSVLRFARGPLPDPDCEDFAPAFEVVRSVDWDDEFRRERRWAIGVEITDPAHEDPGGKSGFVLLEHARYDGAGPDRAHDRATRTGPIIPVNKVNRPEEERLVVVWYGTEPEGVASPAGVVWPDRPVLYHPEWPSSADRIVIASELGSGPLDPEVFVDARVYGQPRLDLAGYNPNEEHALLAPAKGGGGESLFALRSDLNEATTSEPFALLKYRDPASGAWRFRIYEVTAEGTLVRWLWSESAADVREDAVNAVAAGPDGRLHATGKFHGEVRFGDLSLITAVQLGSEPDAFVGTLDAAGRWLWVAQVHSTAAAVEGFGVAADAAGNVYAAGRMGQAPVVTFRSAVTAAGELEGEVRLGNIDAGGDGFVAKWDAGGTLLWARKFSGSVASFADAARAIAVGPGGNVVVTGAVGGASGTFGEIEASAGVPTDHSLFLAKLDRDGEWLWAVMALGPFLDGGVVARTSTGLGVAIAPGGSIALTGTVGLAPLLPPPQNQLIDSGNVLVARWNQNGGLLWKRIAGSAGGVDVARGVALDGSAAIYVAGHFGRGTPALEQGPTLPEVTEAERGFVAKLTPAGAWSWARTFPGAGSSAASIAVEPGGAAVVVSGAYEGSTTFGPGEAGEEVLLAAGGRDIFAARFSSETGALHSIVSAGAAGRQEALAVAAPADGDLLLGGSFEGSIRLGDGATLTSPANTSPFLGDSALFLARLELGFFTFDYEATAGTIIQPPYPLPLLAPPCTDSAGLSGPYWEDYQGNVWARAAGVGSDATDEILVRFFYRLQPGFFDPEGQAIGACLPWLDRMPRPGFASGRPGIPAEITYTVSWPEDAPALLAGETLTEAKRGLPDVLNQAGARVIFDESVLAGRGPLVKLFDPLSAHAVALNTLPAEVDFEALPFDLRVRVAYDQLARALTFAGHRDTAGVGEPLLLPNVMSESDRTALLALSQDPSYSDAVEALFERSRNPGEVLPGDPMVRNPFLPRARYPALQDSASNTYDLDLWVPRLGLALEENEEVVPAQLGGVPLALTAGETAGTGYVTLIFNDDPDLSPLPVSAHVIRVACPVYTGELKVIPSTNVFDESLTLRHSGDFGGNPDRFTFEWYYFPAATDTPPVTTPLDDSGNLRSGWLRFATPDEGRGAVAITIGGPGVLTLSDNWFFVRYCYEGVFDFCESEGVAAGGCERSSGWAGAPGATTAPRPQLAEGWIKRVVRGLNPFEARVQTFHEAPTNTFASMLLQAGTRFEGPVALTNDPASLNQVGLIAAYETVLRRGMELSIEASPPLSFGPANTALLLAAGRIADLYMLLGNEAYADAVDPTIGFDTSGVFGTLAPSLFAFENQLDSILAEELALLRGRDESAAPVGAPPVYNRLFWNFTSGEGEVAYVQAYNLADQNVDGVIDEADARILFPQGHGDAWGHYLTALKSYYRLLRHDEYFWEPRAESVIVAGAPVLVDYLDERKFARAAGARARAGARLVNLTYRERYVEDPAGQWQGYEDTDPDRAWGLSGWARRAGQGAYFDWVAANAILPHEDPDPAHTGVRKIDRTTVPELAEISSFAAEIQSELDGADRGLNPLGLAKDVIPFDIDPGILGRTFDARTHFEQVWDRAVEALKNAVRVFDHANGLTQMLRRNQDSVDDFIGNTDATERDFKNRLIELFGYPYSDDIGPPGPYPTGYDGPDLVHYMYVDATPLATGELGPVEEFTIQYRDAGGDTLSADLTEVEYAVAGSGYPFTTKAIGFSGSRRAPGEIQNAIAAMLQAQASYERGLTEYSNLLARIEASVELLEALHDLHANEIQTKGALVVTNTTLGALIVGAKAVELGFLTSQRRTRSVANDIKEALPRVVGLANDTFSAARAAISTAATVTNTALESGARAAQIAQLGFEQAKELASGTAEMSLETASNEFEVLQAVEEIEELLRQEAVLRLEVYTLREALEGARGDHLAALARADRVLQELITLRKLAAADTQAFRYRDMAFRLFRNEALARYEAQFDMAARYAYLAAKAYDYETNLLGADHGAGEVFLADIVRQRSLGQVLEGQPVAGTPGLGDALGRMRQNFAVLKGQMGFNNPQTETNYFSLRSELFRIRPHDPQNPDPADEEAWRAELRRHFRADLWEVPEFRRYCRPFAPEFGIGGERLPQPGLVIPMPTAITFGRNFFNRELGGGDSSYDPTHFATKVRSVGVWFTNYNATGLARTPRVYLVPAGLDVMRSPTGNTLQTREFSILDQALPVPFPIGNSDLSDPEWIPMVASLSEDFGTLRRYSSFRAFHDAGFDETQMAFDSRLIGRSAWNRKWVLIIPGGTFLFDPEAGLDTFVEGPEGNGDGVSDIRLFFQTYAYSGN